MSAVRCCASHGASVPHMGGLPCLTRGMDSAAVVCGKGVFDMVTSTIDGARSLGREARLLKPVLREPV